MAQKDLVMHVFALPAIYNINLVDSYGDSWNGGSLNVDGTVYTLSGGDADDGSSATFSVGACPVYGCTDSTAANYNAAATDDDQSCTYGVPGCTSADAYLTGTNATADDGSCTFALEEGLDCDGNCLNGGVSVEYTAGGYPGENSFTITDCDGNVVASMSDGSDGFSEFCSTAIPSIYSVNLFDSYGDGWNGGNLTVDGTNYTISYGSSAISSVGACPVYGCTDSTAANYNSLATDDDQSCSYGVPGCTDASACNYDSAATVDVGTCFCRRRF